MMNSNTVQWSEKINISNRLADYVQHKGSQKKASVSLNISNATISQILGSKWESISDEMWRRVSSGVGGGANERSEEHTSELQSRGQLVCRLLLEKNNKKYRAHVLNSH